MNRIIYKYELSHRVLMPKGAEILSVIYQKILSKWFIYALVDLDVEMEIRNFQLVETGSEVFDYNLLEQPTFIATTIYNDGAYILHVFENVKL